MEAKTEARSKPNAHHGETPGALDPSSPSLRIGHLLTTSGLSSDFNPNADTQGRGLLQNSPFDFPCPAF